MLTVGHERERGESHTLGTSTPFFRLSTIAIPECLAREREQGKAATQGNELGASEM